MNGAEYHALPSLSSSGARKLLAPSCPAKFKWERDNPPAPKDAYDYGHAAHRFVLGKGEDIARIDFPDRRTKAAKEAVADARANGLVPLLAKDYDKAVAMAKALRDSTASVELNGRRVRVGDLFTNGEPEVVKHWQDDVTGTPLRSMFDWLRDDFTIVDYKTTESAEPAAFARSVATYGYHMQQAWYVDTLRALGLADDGRFLFVAQEKEPPYLATVIELDVMALEIGRHMNRKAIDLFAQCVATDTWPGYADDVVTVSLPTWTESVYLDDIAPDEITAA